jgi:hypothetical protein
MPAPQKKPISPWWWLLVLLVVVGGAMGGSDDDSDRGGSSGSSCEIAWENSVEKETGGSRSYYIDRCEQGMEDLRPAFED